jgi:hypothetical protein
VLMRGGRGFPNNRTVVLFLPQNPARARIRRFLWGLCLGRRP